MLLSTFCRKSTKRSNKEIVFSPGYYSLCHSGKSPEHGMTESGTDFRQYDTNKKLPRKKSPLILLLASEIESLECTAKEINKQCPLSCFYTDSISLSKECIFLIRFLCLKSMIREPCNEKFFRIFHTFLKGQCEFLFIFNLPVQRLDWENAN